MLTLALTAAPNLAQAGWKDLVACYVISAERIARKPGPGINPQEFAALRYNLDLVDVGEAARGRNRWLGNVRSWEHMFRYGIDARVDIPAVAGLRKLLTSRYASSEDFVGSLDQWAKRNRIPFRFIPPKAIMKYVQENGTRLGLNPKSRGIEADINGYIDGRVYTDLVRNGLFPLGDPHDVLVHLASLADSDFVAALKARTELRADLDRPLGNPSFGALRKLTGDEHPGVRAYAMLDELMSESIRDATTENFTYLVRGPGDRVQLFIQGNAPWNAVMGMGGEGTGREIADGWLNMAGAHPKEFAFDEVENLPKLSKFLKDAQNREVYDRYMRVLREHALERKAYEKAYGKLIEILRSFGIRETERSPLTLANIPFLMNGLAQSIAADKQLAILFSRRGNLELFDVTNEFCRRYQQWIDRKYPLPAQINLPAPGANER
jgi:hypothetical protein